MNKLKTENIYDDIIERIKNEPGFAKILLFNAGITDEKGDIVEYLRPDPCKYPNIYYEDIDSLTVSIIKLMQEWASVRGIVLDEINDLDKMVDYMDDNFRDKYSCGKYYSYN